MYYSVCLQAVPTKPRTHNAKVQTSEPVVDRADVEGLQAQLADTAARLQESERAILVSTISSLYRNVFQGRDDGWVGLS